jgi:hypothetical protein
MTVLTVGSAVFLNFNYKLMELLYSIIFSPASTFCALNFFENRSSPSTLLIEEKTISAIHQGFNFGLEASYSLKIPPHASGTHNLIIIITSITNFLVCIIS